MAGMLGFPVAAEVPRLAEKCLELHRRAESGGGGRGEKPYGTARHRTTRHRTGPAGPQGDTQTTKHANKANQSTQKQSIEPARV